MAPVFGRCYIVPNRHEFFELYPGICVEMSVSDRRVNLIEDGIDLSIRHGDLADSSLTARRLANSPIVTAAAPAYLKCYGVPATPGDLARHACVAFTIREEVRPWVFKGQDGVAAVHFPEGRISRQ